jgi:hypothetical protein
VRKIPRKNDDRKDIKDREMDEGERREGDKGIRLCGRE